MLKWYWWRFNGNGYGWGMVTGIGASIVLPFAVPSGEARAAIASSSAAP